MISETNAQFCIGTCGYAYPGEPPNGWNGVFYRKRGKRRADPLEFYVNYFNAAEINSTFYRPTSAAMASGWVNRTPAGFVFTVKARQKFTHSSKLGDGASGTAEPWAPFDRGDIEYFSAGIAPLFETGSLGGLLFSIRPGLCGTRRMPNGLKRRSPH